MQNKQCNMCVHHWGGGLCEAFPEGIPQAIVIGKHDHSKPFEGDHNIQYELDPIFNELVDDDASA